jgi:DNA (cytosine-5)-methyltransferase 1
LKKFIGEFFIVKSRQKIKLLIKREKMNKDVVLLDLFSGIGGFSLGLAQAGFNITTHYYSEIDKHAIAIYKYQFKNSIYVGDVTTLDGRTITRPNIITFGSPCQDFSMAGRRAGMGGERSSLIGEAIRLIAECRPDLFIWENVKGVFSSSDGRDFWAVIQAFTDLGGYRLEWQLLNTAWFLPQNRERIYLIGHLAKSRRNFREVFPIGYGNSTHDIIQGQSTNAITARYDGLGNGSYIGENKLDAQKTIKAGVLNKMRDNESGIATCISARDYKGYNNQDMDFVIVAQRGREEKCLTPKRTEHGKKIRKKYEKKEITEQRKNIQQLEPRDDGNTNTLTGVQKDNLVVVGNVYGGEAQAGKVYDPTANSPTVSGQRVNSQGFIQVGDWCDDEGLRIREDGNTPTINARAREDKYGVPMVISHYGHKDKSPKESELSPTLKANSHGHEPMTVANAVTSDAYLARGERNRDENGKAVLTSMHDRRIRRLTPVECERLQGFPSGWTEYGDYDGVIKKVADTQRYKTLGNAITVKVMEEIGKHLLEL